MRTAAGGLLLAALLAAAWLRTGPEPPALAPARLRAESVVARGLDLVDVGPEGRVVRLRVGEVVARTGHGFVRSPLLRGIELRDVALHVDGERVAGRDRLLVPRVGLGARPLAAAWTDDPRLAAEVDGLLRELLRRAP